MVAYPLESILPDLKVAGSDRLEVIENLCTLYSLPFDPDIVYDLFENCYDIEALLHSRSKGSAIEKEETAIYSMDGKRWRYYPKNINDFLIDCLHVWEIEPIFEPNLIKRNFRTFVYEGE